MKKEDEAKLDELLAAIVHEGKRHPKSVVCDQIKELFKKVAKTK